MPVAKGSAHPQLSPMHGEVPPRLAEGIGYFERREWTPALGCFNEVLADRNDPVALNFRARTLEGHGRYGEALTDIDRCLHDDPHNITELRNRAILLRQMDRLADSLVCLEHALQVEPRHVDVLGIRAYLLLQLGRLEEAQRSADAALAIRPKDAEARRARALAFELQGHDEPARQDMVRVIAESPRYVDALNDCGRLAVRLGRFRDAVHCYERSLALRPDQGITRYNQCMALLASGDWQRGFEQYEVRWLIAPPEARKILSLGKLWLGKEDVRGKRVLLHHEQGYGDTVQLARYASLLVERGARVILAVPAGLRTLMGSLAGFPEIISEGDPVPPHDFLCPLMSLPLAFRTTPETIPTPVPYLQAGARQVLDWSLRLGPRTRRRIGIVWNGRREAPTNPARDIALELLAPLLTLPAEIISLQKDVSETDRHILEQYPQLRRFGEELHDFADTAALIEHLDLVIAVDSAVAHLAGALGKPVWLLNRYASCWRWGQLGATTPWYPSMRIFRQPHVGDWQSVIQRAHAAALQWLGIAPTERSLSPSDDPASLQRLYSQAVVDHSQGRLIEALEGYQRVRAARPDNAELLQRMAVACAGLKRWQQAQEYLSASIAHDPSDAGAHSNLGNVYWEQGDAETALACYARAITLKPDFAQAHCNQGAALDRLHRSAEALAAFERALACDSSHVPALIGRGNVLSALGRHSEAYGSFSSALALKPDSREALINRATAARRLNHYEQALQDAGEAIRLDAEAPEAHCIHGAALAGIGQYAEALESYDRAIALRPQYPEALWNRGLVLLLQGRLAEGWPLYEWRWRVKSLGQTCPFPERQRWTGQQSLEGKSLLLHAEQGYGDTLQFCRYASLAAGRGAHVILQVPASLVALVRSLQGVNEVIDQGQPAPHFDLHCPLLSLPLAFGTELPSIPAQSAYLQADDALRQFWRQWLGPRQRLRVGLAWAGKPTHSNDVRRSLRLTDLRPLAGLPIEFVALQKNGSEHDRRMLGSFPNVRDSSERLTDFSRTAALIAELDLVVSVDTAIAHLAGALGKAVWVLLPFTPDWRWLLERTDSPWYPTATLFRQSQLNDWAGALERLTAHLRTTRIGDWHDDARDIH